MNVPIACGRVTNYKKYWSEVLREMERIFGRDFGTDPVSLILGLPCKSSTTVASKRFYNILTFAARKNILLQWTSDKSPSIKGWFKVLFDLVHLEYLTNILYAKKDQFYKVWQPYLNYLDPELSIIILQGVS